VEGREIQTEYSTASSARRHDVTKDDNDASSSKQTGSVEKALTSSAQHVTPISEQPTTLDERVIPPEAEINATPTEEQAIGGATSDGADALATGFGRTPDIES
jgi:hypothetical protein